MLSPEVLDEEFECLNRIALAIGETLERPKDRETCLSTLDKMAKFNKAPSLEIKENVHKFMLFYLKVLRWTQKNQPSNGSTGGNFTSDSSSANSEEIRIWMQEGKSYACIKTFEDGLTRFYTAEVKDPTDGWAEFGLEALMKSRNGGQNDK